MMLDRSATEEQKGNGMAYVLPRWYGSEVVYHVEISPHTLISLLDSSVGTRGTCAKVYCTALREWEMSN
jgi:hypothetical protein